MRGSFRGGFRGRGGPMMGGPPMGMRRQPPFGGMPAPSRPPPFDIAMCGDTFPRVNEFDEAILTQEIVNRADKLSPSEAERALMTQTCANIMGALHKVKSDSTVLPGVLIEEIREVGSMKKDTILAGHKTIDVVVILKSMPTVESVHSLGQKVVELVKAEKEICTTTSRDFGCFITSTTTGVSVCLLIATVPSNAQSLEEDLHLSENIMLFHLSSLRHAKWFDEASTGTPVKVLVRVFKDMRRRFPALKPLSVWAIEFMCTFCILHTTNRQPLPLGPAFRRILQLMASGVFLPGSPGLVDPTEPPNRIGKELTFEEMDQVCSTAQTLLRVLGHGGIQQVLGITNDVKDITKQLSYYTQDDEKVVVTPLDKAYSEEDMKVNYEEEIVPPPIPMEA